MKLIGNALWMFCDSFHMPREVKRIGLRFQSHVTPSRFWYSISFSQGVALIIELRTKDAAHGR